MSLKEFIRSALTSGNFLCAFSGIAWACFLFVHAVIYQLPMGAYSYPKVILGAIVMCFLGWYNAEHGTSNFEIYLGLVILYVTILSGVGGILGVLVT